MLYLVVHKVATGLKGLINTSNEHVHHVRSEILTGVTILTTVSLM
jgi:hypothetical protein